MFFKTDIVTDSPKLSQFLNAKDNIVTVDELVNYIKEGERFGNSLLPAIAQVMLSSQFHKTDHSSNNNQDDSKSTMESSLAQAMELHCRPTPKASSPSSTSRIKTGYIMMTLRQQVLVIMKDCANIVRGVSVIDPMEELVQQDEESKTKVIEYRHQSLKILTCKVHRAMLDMIMTRIVGHDEGNPRLLRYAVKQEMNLVKKFAEMPNFSLHTFGSLADKGFWAHTIQSYSLAKNAPNQITNAAAAAAAATSNRSPEEERQLFGRNRRIQEHMLEIKNLRWLEDKFAAARSLFSIKRNTTPTIHVRCPFHKNGEEKKFSMVIEKVFEDDYNNVGNVDDERYMGSIRGRLPYANLHLKTKLLSWIDPPHQREQLEDTKSTSGNELEWWKKLASDEDILPDHKIVKFFEKEANECDCVKWPEKLKLAGTLYGNVYKSSLFSNLYYLSYGFRYTCSPCKRFNVPISDNEATKIICNNTDMLSYVRKRKK